MQFPPSKKPQLTTLSHKWNNTQADVHAAVYRMAVVSVGEQRHFRR